MTFDFEAMLIHWRGPAPFVFAPIPPDVGSEIKQISKLVTYGWGVIPVEAEIGGAAFKSSLFPRDDSYLLPVKDQVRRATQITVGDTVSIRMSISPPRL